MFELTTSVIMLATTFYGGPSIKTESKEAVVNTSNPIIEESASEPITLEAYVREYFKDTPELAEVAFCESTFRHFDNKGRVLKGEVISKDIGIMQINETYHAERSKKLGYDIYTLDGNLGYAKFLYEKQGIKPWNSSKRCWKPAVRELALNK